MLRINNKKSDPKQPPAPTKRSRTDDAEKIDESRRWPVKQQEIKPKPPKK